MSHPEDVEQPGRSARLLSVRFRGTANDPELDLVIDLPKEASVSRNSLTTAITMGTYQGAAPTGTSLFQRDSAQEILAPPPGMDDLTLQAGANDVRVSLFGWRVTNPEALEPGKSICVDAWLTAYPISKGVAPMSVHLDWHGPLERE